MDLPFTLGNLKIYDEDDKIVIKNDYAETKGVLRKHKITHFEDDPTGVLVHLGAGSHMISPDLDSFEDKSEFKQSKRELIEWLSDKC